MCGYVCAVHSSKLRPRPMRWFACRNIGIDRCEAVGRAVLSGATVHSDSSFAVITTDQFLIRYLHWLPRSRALSSPYYGVKEMSRI